MSMPQRIAIVGGGPAGLALALALHRRGVTAGIFEARNRAAVQRDARVLALSHGSVQMLDWLGAWQPLLAQRVATPIRTIHVSHRGGLGRTKMTADELGVDALGQVGPAQALIAALDQWVEATDNSYVEH